MFSEHTLSDIASRINIVDLVSEYVELKKSGQSFSGACPFHNEKTPSFHVHPLKQCFKCFGCQRGGSIFTFYKDIEGLSFPEAVRALAKRAGVAVEHSPREKLAQKPFDSSRTRLFSANKWACEYFHFLLTRVPEYRFALDYLHSRGISDKTIENFRLGVSPKGWNTLLDLMLKKKFPLEELAQAGLIVEKGDSQKGGYDRFRDRLIFPIANKEGEILGFGARLLKEETNQPKYINSPESPLFLKRNTLYGLFQNQRGIRLKNEIILVEGYMDVIGLYERGITNAAATMGTALTEEHCLGIKNLARNVITVFDPDAAGKDAWQRSLHLLMQAGLFAKDLSLPDRLDPDEFVLKNGAEAFYKLCEKAPRHLTKLLKEIASRGQQSEQQTAQILSDLTPILVASRKLPDRALLWDDIALVLNISRAALKELSEPPSYGQSRLKAPPKKSQKNHALSPTAEKPAQPNILDMEVFKAFIIDPKSFINRPGFDWIEFIFDKDINRWIKALHDASDNNFEKILGNLLHQESNPYLLEIASDRLVRDLPQSLGGGLIEGLFARLERRKIDKEIQSITTQIRICQRLGDEEEQMRLLKRMKELKSH